MALVIVDVQTGYKAAHSKRIKKPILNEIDIAKNRKENIIVLEFYQCGPTLKFIKKALEGYEKTTYLTKAGISGADEIVSKFKDRKYKIVGVYTSCCVAATAVGLAKKGLNVTVVENACWDVTINEHKRGLSCMYKMRDNFKPIKVNILHRD